MSGGTTKSGRTIRHVTSFGDSEVLSLVLLLFSLKHTNAFIFFILLYPLYLTNIWKMPGPFTRRKWTKFWAKETEKEDEEEEEEEKQEAQG